MYVVYGDNKCTCTKPPTHTLTHTHTHSDLPPLGSIAVKVFKENFNKKKREKVPATDMGKVEVPSLVLEGGQLLEKWSVCLLVAETVCVGGGGGGCVRNTTASVKITFNSCSKYCHRCLCTCVQVSINSVLHW